MGNNIAWSDKEIHTLLKLRRQGVEFSEIGKKLGRSKKGCKVKFYRLYNVYPNIPIKERAQNTYEKPKYNMCWICKKACIDCKKPVKGWKATVIINHDYKP